MATPSAPDSTLYLYTSLTAGSSHIITATSRLETILKANKIPFRAVDVATDEKARMLWGRRSKGRKLPGVVKFGSIVGVCAPLATTPFGSILTYSQDIEQIEEWNEYGELKEQIAGADEFGTLGASTLGADLNPGLLTTTAETATSTPQRSGPPSRASSETRHISIAEPSKDKEKDAAQKSSDSPGNQILRQLGAEAAAKAALKKTTTTSAAKVPVKATPSTSDQTPTPAATKLSADAAVESPDTVAEVTAGKTPAQLATEGAKRTSVDKIADSEETTTAPTSAAPTQAGEAGEVASTEAQVLEARRSSSITKTKSRLSEATPAEESDTVLSGSASKTAVEDSEISPTVEPVTRKHRGSDIGEASPEEIRALEKKLSIPEEDEDEEEEEDDDDDDSDEEDEVAEPKKAGEATTAAVGVTSTDEAEKEATKGEDTQKEDPKDASKAGASVGD